MSEDAKLPGSVAEAQAVLIHRNRSAVAMMGGMGGFLLIALDTAVLGSIAGTIAWVLVMTAYMSYHEAVWKRASDVLKEWATADRLVEAIRDLHAELAVRDASTDPLVDRLESLLTQVEAESEVVSVGSETEAAERARLARAQRAARQRE